MQFLNYTHPVRGWTGEGKERAVELRTRSKREKKQQIKGGRFWKSESVLIALRTTFKNVRHAVKCV